MQTGMPRRARAVDTSAYRPSCVASPARRCIAASPILHTGCRAVQVAEGHATTIYAYTEEDQFNLYGNFNYACRTPHATDAMAAQKLKVYRFYYYHLDKATSTLTNYNGTVFRGIKIRVPPQAYVTGETIAWHQVVIALYCLFTASSLLPMLACFNSLTTDGWGCFAVAH